MIRVTLNESQRLLNGLEHEIILGERNMLQGWKIERNPVTKYWRATKNGEVRELELLAHVIMIILETEGIEFI